MLQIDKISKSFGDRSILKDFELYIHRGDKIGIIAPNGSGKTTLFKIIMNIEPYDSGNITYERDIKISYLPQLPTLPANKTVMEAVIDSKSEIAQLVRAYEQALLHNDQDSIITLSAKMDDLNAWDFEHRMQKILSSLGIQKLDAVIGKMSGGEVKRVALASCLLKEPDLILLDEPTNHLDLSTIEWLEDYLSTHNTTLLMITHDRYFLDNVCNTIVEIDCGKTFKYEGNYAYYLEKREERMQAYQQMHERNKNLFRKEQEWMRRQPQARGTKARYRIEAFEELKRKINAHTSSKGLQLVPSKDTYVGKKIFVAEHLSLAFGSKTILNDFEYTFARFDKIGIVGENGVGKTSFLKILVGELQPDSGTIDIGETVRFGYYKQAMPPFDPEKKVIEIIQDIADDIEIKVGNKSQHLTPSSLLTQFLFPPERQYTQVGKLSGGELRRLYLCTILIAEPNFLILDEPTNDLDILTLNALEDFLINFKGCVIIVSHDRYFMDKVVTHLFAFEGDGVIKDFPGNYSLYRAYQLQLKEEKENVPTSNRSTEEKKWKVKTSPKISYKEQREIDNIKQKITQLEADKKELELALCDGSIAPEKMYIEAQKLEQINNEIDELTMRWLEIEDKYSS